MGLSGDGYKMENILSEWTVMGLEELGLTEEEYFNLNEKDTNLVIDNLKVIGHWD